VSTYGSLLKTPGVARIIAAQLTARFPFGMLSLAYLIHIETIHHSYGAAGLVLAATSLGQAISGPLTSRWMGVWGMRRVLTLTMVVCAISIGLIAFLVLPVAAYMAIGFVGGLSTPPIQPAVRTIYPKLVNSRQLTRLFSLDASAQEIIWVAGPVITTFVAVQISSTLAIVIAGLFLVVGGTWFILSPEVGRVRIPRSKRRLGVVLAKPAVLLSTITGLLLVAACAATEAAVVATFGEGGSEAGIILAIFALGSLAGGLALGHLPVGPWAMARRMFFVFVGMALAMFSLNFWWIAVALLIAGIGIAPALAVMFAIVSGTVKFSDTAEAYGWVGTGQLIGAALGSAVAGFLIDSNGAIGGYWVAAGVALLGFLVPLVFKRWHPDLRGRDASVPDTAPVPIQPT
jgi:MFS family permease